MTLRFGGNLAIRVCETWQRNRRGFVADEVFECDVLV